MTPRRATAGVRRRWLMLRNRGDAVACPVCGRRFGTFQIETGSPPGVRCWRCGSRERHRALALLLAEHPEWLRGEVLHFAPEWCIERVVRRARPRRYVTGDIDPGPGQVMLDLHALDLPDASFDTVLCSHVLEHVDDDRRAMRELNRVVRPGGTALVLVPIDPARDETYEDPTVRSPEQRQAAYWQHDHARLYARDIADRLAAAGFVVERDNLCERLGPDAAARYGLHETDDIWRASKPAVAAR